MSLHLMTQRLYSAWIARPLLSQQGIIVWNVLVTSFLLGLCKQWWLKNMETSVHDKNLSGILGIQIMYLYVSQNKTFGLSSTDYGYQCCTSATG